MKSCELREKREGFAKTPPKMDELRETGVELRENSAKPEIELKKLRESSAKSKRAPRKLREMLGNSAKLVKKSKKEGGSES